jgi:hypothetical protein
MRGIVLLIAVAACSSKNDDLASEDTGEPPDTTATASTLGLAFELDPDLILAMDEPATGVFHGSVFAEADASAVGPNDGATSLVDFDSAVLDFGAEGGVVSVGTLLPDELAPQIVWILGCLDTTATADDPGDDCECGDPITVPNEDKFQLAPGRNDLVVQLTLLHPC